MHGGMTNLEAYGSLKMLYMDQYVIQYKDAEGNEVASLPTSPDMKLLDSGTYMRVFQNPSDKRKEAEESLPDDIFKVLFPATNYKKTIITLVYLYP